MSRHVRPFAGLACAGVLLAACSDHAIDEPELHRVALPGFSIEVPVGRVKSTANEAFAGRHELQLPDPGILRRLPFATSRRAEARVSVGWNQHGLEDKEYSSLLRGMALKAVPNGTVIREIELAPGTWVLTVGSPNSSVTFASRSCEPGFNVDLVLAVNARANADFGLASTIIQSVVCSLTDANRHSPQAALHLPVEFGRAMGERDPTYVSSTGETLQVVFTSGDIPGSDAFMRLMAVFVSQAVDVPPERIVVKEIMGASDDPRKHRLVSALAAGDVFYQGALWCPKLRVTFMVTYSSGQPVDARAREVFDSVYCPDEPGETPADAKPMLESACATGSSSACETLKSYSF